MCTSCNFVAAFFYTDHQPNIDCTQIKICSLLYLKCIFFLFWWKSNHSFLFCKLVVQAKIPRFPIWWKHFHFFLMKTLSLFFWWKHFHFFWWKHFHFFLTVHFSYTFFMVELSHFTSRGKLRFHVFFIGSLSIMGQFCDNTFL